MMGDFTPRSYPMGMGGMQVNDNPRPDTWRRHGLDGLPWPAPVFEGLSEPYEAMVRDLLGLWAGKLLRNQLRMRYYNGKNVLKDFGISIPPQLLNVETVVGWPQKAVDMLAVRSRFDGFTAASADVQDALDRISSASALRRKYRQAVQSMLIHSCAFATVGMGEDGPAIDLHSAETAAARWDCAKGRIAYGMTIERFDGWRPAVIDLYAEDAHVRAWDTGMGWWDHYVEPTAMGRPTIEAFAYRPTYRRPFGQSRIDRKSVV